MDVTSRRLPPALDFGFSLNSKLETRNPKPETAFEPPASLLTALTAHCSLLTAHRRSPLCPLNLVAVNIRTVHPKLRGALSDSDKSDKALPHQY